LIEFLKAGLPNHHLLSVDRIPFPLKLQLCAALGIMPAFFVAPFTKLNSLRNKVAHKLDYEVSEKDRAEFINSLHPDLRALLVHPLEPNEEPTKPEDLQIGYVLQILIPICEQCRQEYIDYKAERAKALINLVSAVRLAEGKVAPTPPDK
jgi:hypothetical protein